MRGNVVSGQGSQVYTLVAISVALGCALLHPPSRVLQAKGHGLWCTAGTQHTHNMLLEGPPLSTHPPPVMKATANRVKKCCPVSCSKRRTRDALCIQTDSNREAVDTHKYLQMGGLVMATVWTQGVAAGRRQMLCTSKMTEALTPSEHCLYCRPALGRLTCVACMMDAKPRT